MAIAAFLVLEPASGHRLPAGHRRAARDAGADDRRLGPVRDPGHRAGHGPDFRHRRPAARDARTDPRARSAEPVSWSSSRPRS
ncbi:hypothetical protein ACRAWD_28320 [Caulobacter segnis]